MFVSHALKNLPKYNKMEHKVFALDVVGSHVGVQVVLMIIIYQEKILFTYFSLSSFMLITNIKLIKVQSNAHSSFINSCKKFHSQNHRIKLLVKKNNANNPLLSILLFSCIATPSK